jgi:hypothetical protein
VGSGDCCRHARRGARTGDRRRHLRVAHVLLVLDMPGQFPEVASKAAPSARSWALAHNAAGLNDGAGLSGICTRADARRWSFLLDHSYASGTILLRRRPNLSAWSAAPNCCVAGATATAGHPPSLAASQRPMRTRITETHKGDAIATGPWRIDTHDRHQRERTSPYLSDHRTYVRQGQSRRRTAGRTTAAACALHEPAGSPGQPLVW